MDVDRIPDPAEVDEERAIDDDELAEALPERLDAPFEEPIPDVIDQRRVVIVDTDDYDG